MGSCRRHSEMWGWGIMIVSGMVVCGFGIPLCNSLWELVRLCTWAASLLGCWVGLGAIPL